jgi:uncharacterized protein (DUF1330 family)
MAAYVIVDVEVADPEPYEEYRRQVPATLERYARTNFLTVVEGA